MKKIDNNKLNKSFRKYQKKDKMKSKRKWIKKIRKPDRLIYWLIDRTMGARINLLA